MHISFVSLHSAPLGKRICFALVQKEAVDVIAAGRVPNYIVVFLLGDGSMVMNRLDITRLVEQPLSRGHRVTWSLPGSRKVEMPGDDWQIKVSSMSSA